LGGFLLAAGASTSRAFEVPDRRSGEAEGADLFTKPQETLAKSEAPWIPAERLLEAGDRAAVADFQASLPPKRQDASLRLQALLALYAGRYEDARAAVEAVDAKDDWTVREKVYLRDLTRAASGFTEVPSDHFLLRVRPEDAFLSDYALRALGNAHSKMGETFNVALDTAVVVEIYPDEESFSAASTLSHETLERSGAVGICKFGRLMILSPKNLPMGYRWLDALAHEYDHYLINRLSGGLCPLWLHEGVARYYEAAWRRTGGFEHAPAAETQLAGAVLSSGTTTQALIPFRRMEPSMVYLDDQEQVSLAFAEVSDAVAYVVGRFGDAKLAELLRAFRSLPRAEAFQRTLGLSEEELEEAWRDSLKDRHWNVSKGAMSQEVHLKPVDESSFLGPDAEGHIRLGDRLRAQKQAAASLLEYKKAIEVEPDNGVALVKTARAYMDLDDNKKAEEALRRAVEKNPSYPAPFVLLGGLLYDSGRYEPAQRTLQEALEINPYDPKIHELLGMIAIDVGTFPIARKSLEEAVRLGSDNPELREILKNMPKK
jgi:hypothetical protein